ncbi:MAG: hypothetical protein A2842_00635 [Candidatus Wildermuthbacteria bacterium RIFCSPHIGHO2_01_FULL_48_25]|nr:MAG: hypothetical protein A2842_00635 [Candidatus Wildermuthbacteria bacterium RIFCSPHIGHO2_01_FULL_48_25]OHA68438.1 MAG: hypothetical protein A3J57_01105 [Candidatus Wildermuthbacteria bacterium RIFCSPHIGHO2_02_FULL_49_12b]
MSTLGLPKSLRKHVRLEKARIRREVFDFKKQEELIAEMRKEVLESREKKQKVLKQEKEVVAAGK